MRVRVLRLLEYEYDDASTAELDMQNWYIPANGARRPGHNRRMTIRSAIITNLVPAIAEVYTGENDGDDKG